MSPNYLSNDITFGTTTPNNLGTHTITVQVYVLTTLYEFDFVVNVIDTSCADMQVIATTQSVQEINYTYTG